MVSKLRRRIVEGYFGTDDVPLSVTATYAVPAALGAGSITATRTFSSTKELLHQVEQARNYGGMHFYHSVLQGAVLGKKVARQLQHNFFRPINGREDGEVGQEGEKDFH